MTTLVLEDRQGYADLVTYVGRARALDKSGAIRLQADGTVLTAYVGVLAGHGLMGDGAVVGLRVTRLAEPVSVDATVSLASVTDRFARPQDHVGVWRLPVPPTTVQAGWAALAPPRSGWERVGAVPGSELRAAAKAGIAEIATGTTGSDGGPAVAALRDRVWGRLTDTSPPVPAGGAFAAYTLGFLTGEPDCLVAAHGRWTRLSTPAGHVLVR